jgi:hypothetical protein
MRNRIQKFQRNSLPITGLDRLPSGPVLRNITPGLDTDSLRMTFAFVALCDGKIKLGMALIACDEDVANEVLKQYG